MPNNNTTSVAIVGAGLSGLVTAYRLQQHGIAATVIEARDRIGGRVYSETVAGSVGEYGGTWFGPQHQCMHGLLKELGLATTEQFRTGTTIQHVHPSFPVQYLPEPAFEAATKRIHGGSATLVETLAGQLPNGAIRLNQSVASITFMGKDSEYGVHLSQDDGTGLQAQHLVLAGPPRNILKHIVVDPAPDAAWLRAAQDTPTWMGHVGKCLCWFDAPFWRQQGHSGSGFMIGQPAGEFHDVSSGDQKHGVLVGFLDPRQVSGLSQAERRARVVEQFEQLFPGAEQRLIAYSDYLWFDDPLSASPPPTEHPLPADPRREELFGSAMYEGRLHWAGAETSAHYPGYLEGAVAAGERAAANIAANLGLI